VPRYIGSGLGTHIYDDSLREYVPHIPGDYYMEQKEIYDSTELKIRKTSMNLSWSYSPSKKTPGILGDLYWEGYLFLEEHIMAENNSFSSWFPGYISLKNINSKIVKNVEYSDLSYRQDITWNPKKIGGLSANLLLLPSLRQIRSYKESALETGINLDTRKNRWTFGTETRFQRMFHDDTSSKYSYSFKDINIEFQQKFRIGNTSEIFLRNVWGGLVNMILLKLAQFHQTAAFITRSNPDCHSALLVKDGLKRLIPFLKLTCLKEQITGWQGATHQVFHI
jgi:hypothetical protein